MGEDHWVETTDEVVEHEPWRVVYRDENWPGRAERRAELNARPGYEIHERAFVARGAHVIARRFRLGELSLIASGCLVRGDVAFGDNCTFNAGATAMGKVTIGNDVRIASGVVLVGSASTMSSRTTRSPSGIRAPPKRDSSSKTTFGSAPT